MIPKIIVNGIIPQNNAPANSPTLLNSHANPPVIPFAIQLPRGAANPRNSGAAKRKDKAPENTILRFFGIRLSIKWKISEKIHTDKITGKIEPL